MIITMSDFKVKEASCSKIEKQPEQLIEPQENYSIWENKYGRPLTDVEKIEIRTNLSAFFNLMISEHKKKQNV